MQRTAYADDLGTGREYVLVAMLLPRFAVAILVSAMLTACAHGVIKELPTSPGVTIKTLMVLPQGGASIIAGTSVPILTGGTTAGLGALALYTDGSGQFVEAIWTTSDPEVLKVENGSLLAVRRGSALLTARAEGLTASETFIVEPNMAGTWTGTFIVDQCEAGSGSMSELICSNLPGRQPGMMAPGSSTPITFTIEKNGADLAASAQLGALKGTLRGIDRGGNFLSLGGDLSADRMKMTVSYWDSNVKTDVMEGFIGFDVRIDGLPSNAVLSAHFANVTRR